jgi:hypothetical protein
LGFLEVLSFGALPRLGFSEAPHGLHLPLRGFFSAQSHLILNFYSYKGLPLGRATTDAGQYQNA